MCRPHKRVVLAQLLKIENAPSARRLRRHRRRRRRLRRRLQRAPFGACGPRQAVSHGTCQRGCWRPAVTRGGCGAVVERRRRLVRALYACARRRRVQSDGPASARRARFRRLAFAPLPHHVNVDQVRRAYAGWAMHADLPRPGGADLHNHDRHRGEAAACVESSRPEASADSRPLARHQRRVKLRAASSLGQTRAASGSLGQPRAASGSLGQLADMCWLACFTKAAARRGGEAARHVAALPSPAAAVPGRGAAALLGVATPAQPRAAGVAPRSPRRRLERGLEGA